MADKRISFQGVDNGASSMMAKLRQSSQELGAGMISDARKYSQQAKEQLGFLDDQIRAIERRNALEKESMQMQARSKYSGSELTNQLQKISVQGQQDDLQIKLLRELIDTIKLTSKEEIASDRKSVEASLKSFRKDPNQFSPEEQLKLAYQEQLLKPEDKKSIMKDVFTGTFLANALQGILSNLANFAGARNDEQAIGSLLGGIPLIGGLLGASYGRASEEQYAYDVAQGRIRGLTGRRISTLGSFNRFGYSGTEAAGMLEGAFGAAGTSNINAQDYLVAGRAFGLDQGLLNDRLRTGRFTQGGQAEFLSQITRILKASGLEQDRALFGEILRNQTQLVQEFSQTAEIVNGDRITQMMLQTNALGGGFSMNDPRSIQRMQQINTALANPSNDIMQAENLSVLRRLNPNAGMFDILEMQSQGRYTPGFLRGVVGNISMRYGGDDQMAMMALKKRFQGLSFSAVRQLYENRDAIMSGNFNMDQFQSMSRSEVETEAQSATARLDISAAKISDAFVNNVGAGLLEVATQVGGKIGESIISAFEAAGISFNRSSVSDVDKMSLKMSVADYEKGLKTPQ